LPLRLQLLEKYDVSNVTLQRALDRLAADGYIYARGRAGTFVAPHPPHLWQYGLVFAGSPSGNSNWNLFWSALEGEAARITRNGPRRIVCYYGTEHPQESPDYHKLLDDIRHRRLAGIIFASQTSHLQGLPVITEPGIARVEIASASERGIPSVSPQGQSVILLALDYLKSRGRKKVALILSSHAHGLWANFWMEAVARHGLSSAARWFQGLDLAHPECATNAVELMFYAGANQRPDGLIIADDNLLETALSGLLMAGVKVGADLDLVAHCNFPKPRTTTLPIKRVGFDVHDVMAACLAGIDAQIQGATVPLHVDIPAKFEEHTAAAIAAEMEMPPARADSGLDIWTRR
ncbi:MAG: substrate-binding domain-containing protein, partial [Phycisphaerae bacterium]|nr:substrate-binding domain-containing protein [Phycisphaerae bacterium]